MKASIVIPTKDKLYRLRLVLQALEKQINDDVEVIIVFDGCNEDTLDQFNKTCFSFSPIPIVCEHNVGRAAARNLGIQRASGDIIIFVDDDRVPDQDFVNKHIYGHQNEKCVLLGERKDVFMLESEIKDLFDQGLLRDDIQILKSKVTKKQLQKGVSIHHINMLNWLSFYTGNVSIKKKYLEQIGFFDEKFKGWGHEDLDLGIRLSNIGLKFKKDNSLVNYHLLHDSNFNVKEKVEQSNKNLKYMIRKYKRSYIQWILFLFYLKHRLVGLNINKNVMREKKTTISK
ncbi:glycosyltransferase family 2 protein [Chengkuizengella marina]|uniref:Glycosyltransferase n=1 Tax=Chengkuizengella marina TaxID=2507566 RepID=A0A6N9PZ82_9BACL|nr:glycosyltransferase [Chengkuizengella marina]NBI28186.1 glycosyltransferase [Chengkuizengella marina]